MLNEKQINEIREHLEKAQNPIFFFDNDPDGLCSFLLLRRFLGRGRGVAIKSFPSLDLSYFRKVEELNADYIFILDKPVVSQEFLDKTREVNIPIVWIDHHDVQSKIPEFISYYNPYHNGNHVGNEKASVPVTYFCYQVTRRKEDIWIAVIGCISDSYLPDFYSEFETEFPDLSVRAKTAFDVLYKSSLGVITKIVSSGLKDKTSNVVNMLRFLINAKSPYDVLNEDSKNRSFHNRSTQIAKKYNLLYEKAKKHYKENGGVLFFKYSGDLSISGELANELLYNYPEKTIVVAYVNGGKVNISLRGKEIKERFLKVIEGYEGSSGGGHKDAVGGVIQTKDLEDFVEKLKNLL